MSTVVVNIHKKEVCQVYIGRPAGPDTHTHYGNPFSHLPTRNTILVPDRETAIRSCEDWLRGTGHKGFRHKQRMWILAHLHTLNGKRLGCFCHPLPCHGDIYVRLLKENFQGVKSEDNKFKQLL